MAAVGIGVAMNFTQSLHHCAAMGRSEAHSQGRILIAESHACRSATVCLHGAATPLSNGRALPLNRLPTTCKGLGLRAIT
jgi:hypothetical protein